MLNLSQHLQEELNFHAASPDLHHLCQQNMRTLKLPRKSPVLFSGLREQLFILGATFERLIYAAQSKEDIFNDEWKCHIDPMDRL